MTAVVFAGMGMSSVSIGFPRIPIMVIVGLCDFIAARRTSLRGGTVGRSAWSMGGGFGMALIPLTSAGMLLVVAGVFPFAPVMTQLFPVGTPQLVQIAAFVQVAEPPEQFSVSVWRLSR